MVEQLHKALQDLVLSGYTDYPGFTTGPRRALALMQFRVRQHEDQQGMRERMGQIIGTVNRSALPLRDGVPNRSTKETVDRMLRTSEGRSDSSHQTRNTT